MADCKSISTHLDKNVKLHQDSGKACDPTWFRLIIGRRIYLRIIQPDLIYPVSEKGDDANKGKKANTKTWFDVVKGLKTEDELEKANSDESGNKSETTDSVRMFDSEMPNERKAKWRKGSRKRRQYRDNKGAKKGRTRKQVDRKGRGAQNRTGRGAQVRREARRSRSENLEQQVEPQLSLRGGVEIQAQHCPGQLHKPRAKLDEDQSDRPGLDRRVKSENQIHGVGRMLHAYAPS